jgi:hypothetical protein
MRRKHQRTLRSHLHRENRAVHGHPLHHNKAKTDVRPPTGEYASAVGQHARTTGHHYRPEDVTYLDRESNKMAQGIKEAIYIRALNPDLNIGRGQYALPEVDILASFRGTQFLGQNFPTLKESMDYVSL